jgi:hypothetical protein
LPHTRAGLTVETDTSHTRGTPMAKRRRPQPRDNRGRFTSTGIPMWLIVLVVVVLAAYIAS